MRGNNELDVGHVVLKIHGVAEMGYPLRINGPSTRNRFFRIVDVSPDINWLLDPTEAIIPCHWLDEKFK